MKTNDFYGCGVLPPQYLEYNRLATLGKSTIDNKLTAFMQLIINRISEDRLHGFFLMAATS